MTHLQVFTTKRVIMTHSNNKKLKIHRQGFKKCLKVIK